MQNRPTRGLGAQALSTLSYLRTVGKYDYFSHLNNSTSVQFQYTNMFSFYFQGDGVDIRPHSMEGPMDSGISVSGDTISSPDSDISLQHQSVSQPNHKFMRNEFTTSGNPLGPRSKTFEAWTCTSRAFRDRTDIC